MLLRDVTENDLPILFEHQREPEANRMAAFPAREYDAFMAHWREKVLPIPSNMKKAIVVDGVVVGNIVSWEGDGKRLVGYWIGSAHWGRGIASAALAAFVAHHERTRPLHAYVAAENVGSIRVLEKAGFRPAGPPIADSHGVTELLMLLESPPSP
ncbi:GNAT family N-acetyltransferase [Pendulispora brunnea]|uniref:GNAT family N-acetyltransferase n=1 Tax=Pendulispora brunnea TaxID=2905690 RepID=A0ABZ2KLZ5_9BACT